MYSPGTVDLTVVDGDDMAVKIVLPWIPAVSLFTHKKTSLFHCRRFWISSNVITFNDCNKSGDNMERIKGPPQVSPGLFWTSWERILKVFKRSKNTVFSREHEKHDFFVFALNLSSELNTIPGLLQKKYHKNLFFRKN